MIAAMNANTGEDGTAEPPTPEPGRRRKVRRAPRKITATSLENAALYYLGRFATSAENLRRVLMRRVERAARVHQSDRGEGAALVDALVRRYLASGLLDDDAYTHARVAALRRAGASARAIRGRLLQKGLARDAIETALAAGDAGPDDAEFHAAAAMARRRRLGPYRDPDERRARRQRDMAAMARAGFAHATAHRVLDAASVEALEHEAAAGMLATAPAGVSHASQGAGAEGH